MTNEEMELLKFVNQHPEYKDEYAKGNLFVNLFSDIVRDKPRGVIAASDLPHNLDLIGTKLARSWEVTEQRKDSIHSRLDRAKAQVKSQQSHSNKHNREEIL